MEAGASWQLPTFFLGSAMTLAIFPKSDKSANRASCGDSTEGDGNRARVSVLSKRGGIGLEGKKKVEDWKG